MEKYIYDENNGLFMYNAHCGRGIKFSLPLSFINNLILSYITR